MFQSLERWDGPHLSPRLVKQAALEAFAKGELLRAVHALHSGKRAAARCAACDIPLGCAIDVPQLFVCTHPCCDTSVFDTWTDFERHCAQRRHALPYFCYSCNSCGRHVFELNDGRITGGGGGSGHPRRLQRSTLGDWDDFEYGSARRGGRPGSYSVVVEGSDGAADDDDAASASVASSGGGRSTTAGPPSIISSGGRLYQRQPRIRPPPVRDGDWVTTAALRPFSGRGSGGRSGAAAAPRRHPYSLPDGEGWDDHDAAPGGGGGIRPQRRSAW